MAEDNFTRLKLVMAHLRGPEGCPWDRKQNYESLKPMLLEETYELIDAINESDFASLKEELGDLLFLVIFYSRLAEEGGLFSLDDVAGDLLAKLVRRHPHVFGEKRARNAEEALASWQAAKEEERRARNGWQESEGRLQSLLDRTPRSLPALLESHELGVRAARAGFDWPAAESLLDKITEEIGEIRTELHQRQTDARRLQEEAGDLLFAVANLARHVHSDPESCLRRANRKFRRRFQALEDEVRRRGEDMTQWSARDLDALWEEVKKSEKA